jgi:hypothetical protein
LLEFTPPVYNGGSEITGYKYILNNSITTIGMVSSPYTITGLTNGTDYEVKLIASNATGESLESNARSSISISNQNPLIINSVEFLPLFGAKSPQELRATIKVIPALNSTASTSEIKNLVIATMDAYFDLANWDFGETFYFSELSAFIHSKIGGIVASVVLVPLNIQKSFGDLYEIRSAPNQIFVNGATVNDVEVITAAEINDAYDRVVKSDVKYRFVIDAKTF